MCSSFLVLHCEKNLYPIILIGLYQIKICLNQLSVDNIHNQFKSVMNGSQSIMFSQLIKTRWITGMLQTKTAIVSKFNIIGIFHQYDVTV